MKKNLRACYRSVLVSLVALLTTFAAKANHVAGIQMYYTSTGGFTYTLTMIIIGDCGNNSINSLHNAVPRVCLYNNTTLSQTLNLAFVDSADITPVCTGTITKCQSLSSTIPGYRQYRYTANVTLGGSSNLWRFIFQGSMGTSSAGRSSSIVNIASPGSSVIQLIDTLNNTVGVNSNAVSGSAFTPFFCQNNNDSYNPGMIDPNTDSLVFALVAGKVGTGNGTCTTTTSNVTYNSGYSAAAPLGTSTSSWTFNSTNGQIDFVPTIASTYMVDYNVREFRGGTFVGNSMFESNFVIQTCTTSPPMGNMVSSTGAGAITDSTHYVICVGGGPFTVDMTAGSSDPTLNIEMSATGLPAGSSFSVAGDSTSHPVGTFTWNASTAAPGTYTFYLNYRDDQCPVNGTNTQAFTVTIQAIPSGITGTPTVCVNSTRTLANSISGGTWTSNDPSIASVNASTGVVTGNSAGVTTITYTVSAAGCYTTTAVTVNALPNPIAGTLSICAGNTTTLTTTSGGGTWLSSATTVATIGTSNGVALGLSAGTSTISYRFIATGCASTAVLTVNALPTAITGSSTVCTGSTVTLVGTPTGGTWSANNTNVTVDPTSGAVTGATAGTSIITYTNGNGCFLTRIQTVNTTPTINPTSATTLCLGGNMTLSGNPGGGTWLSSNTAVATVNTSGFVQSVGVGTANITYTTSTGCNTIKAITVNTAPAAITPASPTVCVGSTVTLGNTVSGGVWTSGTTSVATISTGGVATGVTNGTSIITYAIGSCSVTATLTVNSTPTINPTTAISLCVGNVTTLTATIAGGNWASGATAVATIGTGGNVTATGAGTTTITYTLPATGCFNTKVITVNTTPAAITPASPTVCVGSTLTLGNTVSGGTWISSGVTVAAIGSSTGEVTGNAAGTTNITYSIGTCTVATTLTVNALPTAFTPGALCVGTSTTLNSLPATGTWTSGNTAVGTIGASNGVLTGLTAGTTNITYTLPTTCFLVATATVNTAPAAITPASTTLCAGTTATLSNGVTGGVWSSSNTAAATVAAAGAGTGVVTGVAAGTSNITYAIGTCTTSVTVTVNAAALAITPSAPSICVSASTTLTNATPGGGTWSSSNTAVATIGSSSGVLTGTGSGTTNITFTSSLGCTTSVVATVNSLAVAGTISGPSTICQATSALYTSSGTAGGTWSTSTGNVTIGTSGTANGVTVGADVISYTVANGCGSVTATLPVSVNPAPNAGTVSGASMVCVGSASVYTSSGTAGGTWSVSNTNATIVGSGVFTGVTAGLTVVSYSVTNSCGTAVATMTVSVNPLGSAGTISGPTAVCVSGLISLTATVGGGVWSSSNNNATVGSTSGIVTGVLPGLDTISYTVTGACGLGAATYIVSVLPLPTAGTLSGPTSVCVASTITLSSTVAGGTWTASNSNASIGASSGIVTGVTAGTVVMTYTYNDACGSAMTSTILTVNPLPAAGTLSGLDSVCTGASITLSSTVSGGTWLAGNSNATVSSSGVVTGFTAGTTPITYTYTNMCGSDFTVKIINVVAPPTAGTLSGPSMVCTGAGITVVATVGGGIWTASNTSASIVGPGIVLGNTAGVDTIFYTVTNMCGVAQTSKIINVVTTPTVSPISGPTHHCVGSSITLNSATPGGNWTSSNMAVAPVGLTTGIVNGLSAGVVTITYTVNTGGCPGTATALDTVLTVPTVGAISGPSSVCVGATISLTNSTSGGTWVSSNTSAATIDAAGNVTGVASGTTTVSYTVNNICGTTVVTKVVSVNPLPTVLPISGLPSVCVNSNMTLTSATSGGVWTSGNTGVATVGLSSGVVTGVSAGTAIIIYTVTNGFGCSAFSTFGVSVNPLPSVAPITGPTAICVGATGTLANATAGGVWFSGSPAIATIGAGSGVVNGISAGTVILTYAYTDAFGCTGLVNRVDTIVAPPSVTSIGGPSNVCVNATITLTYAGGAGTWSSASPNVTVGAAGDVTGVSAGTALVSYTVTGAGGCSGSATRVITVNGLPTVAAISGTAMECVGGTTTLADATPGGTWSSSAATVATVGAASGIVSGVTAGTAMITYSVTDAFGCVGTATIENTVNALPAVAAISGTATECIGSTTLLTDATPGGVWSSGATSIATVAGGTVTGVAAGTATITYAVTDGFGCTGIATVVNTVTTTPSATPITGTLHVCVNAVTTLANSTAGGVWSSASTGTATIGASAGDATGVAAGTVSISYVVTNACGSVANTAILTVNALPATGTISSPFATLCAGAIGAMTSTVSGGTWSSSNTAVATVNISTGVVTGVSTGTTEITYTTSNSAGCTAFTTFTLAVAPGLGTLAVLPTPGATFCDSMSVYMFVTPPTPGLIYQWRLAGVDIPGANADNYTATVTGNYSVIVGNGLCSQILTGPTVVNPPSPVIGYNPPAQLFTGSYAGYQWFLNGVAIPGATNAVYNYTTDGVYTVQVTDVNGCAKMSQPYKVSNTGVAAVAPQDINVYPNPATSTVVVDAKVDVNLVLVGMDGKIIDRKDNATRLDVSKLPAGMYMVMIYDQDNNLLKAVKFAKVD